MKPSPADYKQLREMDERLIRFKESEFTRLGHPDPRGMFILVHIFAIPFLGWSLLLMGLLWEWLTKFSRMCWIAMKAGYFYLSIESKKTIDRLETKLFELWRKMI